MPDEQAQPSVPFWALNLVSDVAAIKARTDRLPVIERELDEFRAQQVPISEHKDVMLKANTLWDAWQRSIGARARDRLWLTLLSLGLTALGLLEGLHLTGHIP